MSKAVREGNVRCFTPCKKWPRHSLKPFKGIMFCIPFTAKSRSHSRTRSIKHTWVCLRYSTSFSANIWGPRTIFGYICKIFQILYFYLYIMSIPGFKHYYFCYVFIRNWWFLWQLVWLLELKVMCHLCLVFKTDQ